MRKIILAVVFCMAPGILLADSGDTRTVEMWQCELKEGKTMKEVQANNVKWLAHTRKTAGSEEVHSYALQAVVGDLSKFVFVDSYPDMATWSAGKSAEQSDEGKAIEAAFEELMDCTKTRLYKATQH